jgi:acetate kinase
VDLVHILALNSGSSSLKFALYQFRGPAEQLLARGEAENIGSQSARFWLRDADSRSLLNEARAIPDHAAALKAALEELTAAKFPRPAAIGHRVVMGGSHSAPEKVTPPLLAELHSLIPLAPLHLPAEIKIMQAVATSAPAIPQVACFDTAFHRSLPELAQRFPLPRNFFDQGVRRYGFHGLSYEYVLQQLGPAAKGKRLVIAHLGNGASLAAINDGVPVDTSMGLTPTGGIMMGTRTGDLDPGVLIYLLREKHYDAATLERLLDHQSGLVGVSGTTSDMKQLLAARASDPRAAQAIAMFCRSVRKQIGAFAAVLVGLDMLVFTGGIGERASAVRDEICRDLHFLGIKIDPAKNDSSAEAISGPESRCSVRVIATNEELMIARHARALIFGT